jgi:hypothetical protein
VEQLRQQEHRCLGNDISPVVLAALAYCSIWVLAGCENIRVQFEASASFSSPSNFLSINSLNLGFFYRKIFYFSKYGIRDLRNERSESSCSLRSVADFRKSVVDTDIVLSQCFDIAMNVTEITCVSSATV